MNKKNLQIKKLAQYTAASAAFLAVHDSADAQVTYSDLDPDSTITSADTIYLDLNLDSINDIMFWIESKSGIITTSSGGTSSYFYRFAKADALNYNVLVGDEGTYSGYVFRSASQFASGEMIGYNTPDYFGGSASLGGAIFVNGDTIYSAGPWSGADGQFLGMRFKYDGYNHWAWLRVSVGDGGSAVTVHDFAYVTTEDVAIPAGVTTAVEPAVPQNKPFIFSTGSSIHIRFQEQDAQAHYFVFDLAGKQILNGSISDVTEIIDCNNFPSGIYLVKVFDGKNTFQEKVMITNL